MEKYFDSESKRLLFFKSLADDNFWDKHWKGPDLDQKLHRGDPLVTKYTQKYLSANSRILEGGCGTGANVYRLDTLGYDVYGVDYAQKTIIKSHRIEPDLKLIVSDVKNLPFKDSFFDANWSLGVIEHFLDGYRAITSEMSRIIKSGGYLFISFPVMSVLRKFKAKYGFYTRLSDEISHENFYQYAYPVEHVINQVEEKNFTFVEKKYSSAFKGLKDECQILNRIMQKIYNSNTYFSKFIKLSIEILFNKLSPHMVLLVFQKK